MSHFYSLGIDFGTLSARAVLVDIATGEERATSVYGYQDAVIDKYIPGSDVELPPDYALQNPADYHDALEALLRDIWQSGNVDPSHIRSIGIAFTACTVIPVDKAMKPLCMNEEFRMNPHSWAKLWKHHGAQQEADRINEVAGQRGESFIKRYGGRSSSEWYFAKLFEIYNKAPKVYQAMDRFVNAADWVIWLLTGRYVTSSCMAGYKCFWQDGFPDEAFFAAVDPGLEHVVAEKVRMDVKTIGSPAGGLCRELATLSGLTEGIPVAVSVIDAHAGLPAVGIRQDGSLLMAMGTSLCHILVSSREVLLDGISGVVYDGVIPGLYGYEAGQAAVGDIYDWFVNNIIDYASIKEAEAENISLFDAIGKKAARLRPGESGLIALDWWNGNRSMLSNSNLTGVILGLTLASKPEDIYRALVEATAFGTRSIVESFQRGGVAINHIYACGGLSRKSPLVMQIFADVLGQEIHISNISQTTAYGAAMYGMVALGAEAGGYASIEEATARLIQPSTANYKPVAENHRIYSSLFEQYKKLHDYFGKMEPQTMLQLKKIKESTEQDAKIHAVL